MQGEWPNTMIIDKTLLLFFTLLPKLTSVQTLAFYLISRGFHRTYSTGLTCKQRMLTPRAPNTETCPDCDNMSSFETSFSKACHVSGLWISNIPKYFFFSSLRYFKNPFSHDLQNRTIKLSTTLIGQIVTYSIKTIVY